MLAQWRIAALGALGGAVIAVGVVFAAARLGYFPAQPIDGKQIHAWLMAHPGVVDEMSDQAATHEAEAQEREMEAAVHAIPPETFFDAKLGFVTGPVDAKRTLAELFDYNCPYCRASFPALKRYYEAHKNDTRFAFIELPFKGPASVVAARASLAARLQPDKYIPFHFALMSEPDVVTEEIVFADAAKAGLDIAKLKADMLDPSVDVAIREGHDLAVRAKVTGTPAFILNGRGRMGAMDDKTLNGLMAGHEG
jgi:protein-disulfide isomerase